MTTAATINLGRACSISVGGVALAGVRSVTASLARSEIEVPVFSGGETYIVPGSRTVALEIETIAFQDYVLLLEAMNDVYAGVIVASNHVSASFVVTSLNVSEPLDDVVSYIATLKRTFENA